MSSPETLNPICHILNIIMTESSKVVNKFPICKSRVSDI